MFTESFIKTCLDKGIKERDLMIVLDHSRGVSFADIARDEGVSPERIRQIEARTLRRMKKVVAFIVV